jgi:hypothetical protein
MHAIRPFMDDCRRDQQCACQVRNHLTLILILAMETLFRNPLFRFSLNVFVRGRASACMKFDGLILLIILWAAAVPVSCGQTEAEDQF